MIYPSKLCQNAVGENTGLSCAKGLPEPLWKTLPNTNKIKYYVWEGFIFCINVKKCSCFTLVSYKNIYSILTTKLQKCISSYEPNLKFKIYYKKLSFYVKEFLILHFSSG